jgi:hypothetical protein
VAEQPEKTTLTTKPGDKLRVDLALDSAAASVVVKAIAAAGPFASPTAYCPGWPAIAADEQNSEPEYIEPTSCALAKGKLPAPVEPFGELAVLAVTADRIDRKLLFARVGKAWYQIAELDDQYEVNRGGGSTRVEELFFQDVVKGAGSELVLRTTTGDWSMPHDDEDADDYSSGTTTLDICRATAKGAVMCAEIPYGAENNDGGDDKYEFVLDVALDKNGRVHVIASPDAPEEAKKLVGVFEPRFAD